MNDGAVYFFSVMSFSVIGSWYRRFHKPTLYYVKSKTLDAVVKQCKALHKYTPPPLLDHYGHVHTLLSHFSRQAFIRYHAVWRELVTLPDGGTVAMDWLPAPPTMDAKKPIVILIHGLCGNSESNHIVYAGHEFSKQGYAVGAFIARGCGGLSLTTPESFTAARTSDLAYVLDRIHKQYPDRPIAAVGYSLGAGILLKYLGQHGDKSLLTAAVAVSPSWNFLTKTPYFDTWSTHRLAGTHIPRVKIVT
jgi:abhydrolase domain-containing protein 1/3